MSVNTDAYRNLQLRRLVRRAELTELRALEATLLAAHRALEDVLRNADEIVRHYSHSGHELGEETQLDLGDDDYDDDDEEDDRFPTPEHGWAADYMGHSVRRQLRDSYETLGTQLANVRHTIENFDA